MADRPDYPIELWRGILAPKHYKAMGSAVWVFIWAVDRQTSETGWILGGKWLTYKQIGDESGAGVTTIRHLERLEKAGYLVVETSRGLGVRVRVRNPKRTFGKPKNADCALQDADCAEAPRKLRDEKSNLRVAIIGKGTEEEQREEQREEHNPPKAPQQGANSPKPPKSGTRAAKRRPHLDTARRVLEVWSELTGRTHNGGTDAERKSLDIIADRLAEGSTEADCERAIRGCMTTHNVANGYTGCGLIFRPGKFEDYRDRKPQQRDRRREGGHDRNPQGPKVDYTDTRTDEEIMAEHAATLARMNA